MPGATVHSSGSRYQRRMGRKDYVNIGIKETLLARRGLDGGTPEVTSSAATKRPWEFRHRGRITRELEKKIIYCEQMLCIWRISTTLCEDKEHPYALQESHSTGYVVTRWEANLWCGQETQRWSRFEFRKAPARGYETAVDWPIRYEDVAPWYSTCRNLPASAVTKMELSTPADGEFLPPWEFNYYWKINAAK